MSLSKATSGVSADSSLIFVTDAAPGTMAFEEALTTMNGVIVLCQQGRLGIVQAADRLEEFLEKEDLLYYMRIDCRAIGFDPSNRDKVGGNPLDVHALISAIKKAGWSAPAVSHATCVEIIPGDTTVEEFNRRFCEGTDLMQVRLGSIKYGSLSCGHNNMGHRAILASCPHPDPAVTKDGRLSVDVIRQTDPRYADAIQQGMEWKVLKYEVRQRYPEALRIIQAARNVFGHVQRQTSVVQGLKQIHNMVSAFQSVNRPVDWDEIRRAVLDTQPPFADDIEFLINFVIGKSGGLDYPHLDEFVVSHRNHTHSKRRVPGELFGVLADFPWTYVAFALLVSAYNCDKKYLNKDGVSTYLQVGQVQAMKKADSSAAGTASSPKPAETKIEETSRLKCVQAELMLSQARERLPAAGVTQKPAESNELTQCLTRLDKKVGQFVLGKDSPISVLHEAGFMFVSDLQKGFPNADGTKITVDWPEVVSTLPPTQDLKAEMPSAQMYNIKAGVVQDAVPRLRALGMDTNKCVGRPDKADEFLRITKIGRADVELEDWYQEAEPKHKTPADKRVWQLARAAAAQRVPVEAFVAGYVPKKPKVQNTRHPKWPTASAFKNPMSEARLLCERARLLYAASLVSVYCAENFRLTDIVDVFWKPKRFVIATAPCPAGTILMPFDSDRVKMCKKKPGDAGRRKRSRHRQNRRAP